MSFATAERFASTHGSRKVATKERKGHKGVGGRQSRKFLQLRKLRLSLFEFLVFPPFGPAPSGLRSPFVSFVFLVVNPRLLPTAFRESCVRANRSDVAKYDRD